MILLTNELSRKHPGLNAGSLGTVVQLPKLQAQQRRMGRSGPQSSSSIAPDELGLGQVVLDQVCAPTTEQLQCSLSASLCAASLCAACVPEAARASCVP